MSYEVMFGPLAVGSMPRVVGTVSEAATLEALARNPSTVQADVVEVRLDLIGREGREWSSNCAALNARVPLLFTVRMVEEGGAWQGTDEERLELYRAALPVVAAIDVELASPIRDVLLREAADQSVGLVLSHHDFSRTPPLAELRECLAAMATSGRVVGKVATMLVGDTDVDVLASVLREPRDMPVCMLGMGELGGRTREDFPLQGSCLTYGFLDRSAAPGQVEAGELVDALSRRLPAYATDRAARTSV